MKNDYGFTLRICAVVIIIILGITSPLGSKTVLNIDIESKSFPELVVIFTTIAIVIFFILGRPIHHISNVLKK
ncbi:hypothetical protein J1P26_08125 [Neobacillus sp. MM2021_6]|uniref:hypothetical protein n=1 Tax=Neobacillus sp. MM2021_6 TaxID=2817026 RepID=UPI001A9421D0|nr:hypothetical protein [Neobacillus sp. MM2021_6]MBO0959687.1 hypothetical protein [Neobacillus sp. MM2021_6]